MPNITREQAAPIINQIKTQQNLSFDADRDELRFETIEDQFTTIDFNSPLPHRIPSIYIQSPFDILWHIETGQIANVKEIDRIRLYASLCNGELFYKRKAEDRNRFEVMILFPANIETEN